MELKCVNCGSPIPAENINIQKTLAVCAECNHVFDFSNMVSTRKPKRRPPKKPERLQVHEKDKKLKLSYRRVYSSSAKLGFAMCGVGSVLIPFLVILAANKAFPPEPSFFVFFGVLMLVLWYCLAAFLTTKTEITADEDAIVVKTGPLPFPIKDDKVINSHEINRVFHKEIMEWPPGMLSYNVSMEMSDGQEKSLVTSLPQEYAFYLAQRLDDFLHENANGNEMVESGDEFYGDSEQDETGETQMAYLLEEDDEVQSTAS